LRLCTSGLDHESRLVGFRIAPQFVQAKDVVALGMERERNPG